MQKILSESVLWQMPGVVVWKDLNCKYMGCNKAVASIIGFNSIDEIVGLSDYELPGGAAENAELFISQDKKAMAGQPQLVLDGHYYKNGNFVMVLINKHPLYDQNHNVIGVIQNGIRITDTLLGNISFILCKHDAKMKMNCNKNNQFSYIVDGIYTEHDLTNRESQCLFYMLRGKTFRETADILGISIKTVASYVENIKLKFDCKSKSELIEYSIARGFLHAIPRGVINESMSIVLN